MSAANNIIQKIDIRLWQLQAELRKLVPRYFLRKKVEKLPCIQLEADSALVVAIFCGKSQVLEGIASCYSFYKLSGKKYSLYWFDDGTLTKSETHIITSIFPHVRIILAATADKQVSNWLNENGHSNLMQLRSTQIFGRRLTDVNFYLQGKAVLLLDSDLLFFQYPAYLMRTLENFENTGTCNWVYNVDIRQSYCTTTDNINQTSGLSVITNFNTGLFFFQAALDNLSYLEAICANGLIVDKLYYWEQTLFAILATKNHAKPLPDDYDVHFRFTGSSQKRLSAVSRHYCSDARPFFYKDFDSALKGA